MKAKKKKMIMMNRKSSRRRKSCTKKQAPLGLLICRSPESHTKRQPSRKKRQIDSFQELNLILYILLLEEKKSRNAIESEEQNNKGKNARGMKCWFRNKNPLHEIKDKPKTVSKLRGKRNEAKSNAAAE